MRVYVKAGRPCSAGAMRLLREKGIPFEEIDGTRDPGLREELEERLGGPGTLPQAFSAAATPSASRP